MSEHKSKSQQLPLINCTQIRSNELEGVSKSPDVVIIEIPLSLTSPAQVIRTVKQKWDVPVLFLVGDKKTRLTPALKEAFQSGLCDSLINPSATDFVSALQILLQLHS